jgi:hypothetical protein
MSRAIAFAFLALAGACSLARKPSDERPMKDEEIARVEEVDEDEQPPAVFDPEERRRREKQRFPGLDRLDFVRFLLWPAEPSGPCWSQIDQIRDMKIEARYEVGGKWRAQQAEGIHELRGQGWLALYRTPAGTGFERKAEFESVDLTIQTAYACKCNLSADDQRETRLPVRLRFRWTGKGALPEASGRIVRDGKTVGLPMGIAPGRLTEYEFSVREAYPFPQPARCGGTMSVQIFGEPPMF